MSWGDPVPFPLVDERTIVEAADAILGRHLVAILSRYAGERGISEGAVKTLERLIAEREAFATSAVATAVQSLEAPHV